MFDNDGAVQIDEAVSASIASAHDALQRASHILVGAGAGLSSAAGLTYFGERFDAHFKNFIDYYGMTDLYSSGFYPFPDSESAWAYWAERIWLNRYNPASLDLYDQLYTFFRNRDYFVVTTNVDGQFAKAGFSQNRIFAVQGDYGLMQCKAGCHDALYSNRDVVDAIRLNTRGGERVRVSDAALVPACPRCGGEMAPWVCIDEGFLRGESWQAASKRYRDWLAEAQDSAGLVLLEMGVGFSAPDAVRFPLERLAQSGGCTLVRMNFDAAAADVAGIDGGISVPGDIAQTWPLVANGV